MTLVKEALVAEFKDLAEKAISYKKTIETAKTYAKREIYKKRLKENNIEAAQVLDALQKLMQKENVAVGAENGISSNERSIETESTGTAALEPRDSTGSTN